MHNRQPTHQCRLSCQKMSCLFTATLMEMCLELIRIQIGVRQVLVPASEIEPASSGNTALAYPGMNYQGIEFAAQTTVANMEYLHVDIWVPAGTTADLKITPINNGTGVGEFLFSMTYTAGQWSSIDIPKSSFTGMTWG